MKKKILYKGANNFFGWAMNEYLPYDEIKVDRNVKLEDILNTADDSDIVYSIEVDLNYPDKIKENTKPFPLAPEIKIIQKNKYDEYMKKINLKILRKIKIKK